MTEAGDNFRLTTLLTRCTTNWRPVVESKTRNVWDLDLLIGIAFTEEGAHFETSQLAQDPHCSCA